MKHANKNSALKFVNINKVENINGYYFNLLNNLSFTLPKNKISNFSFIEKNSENAFISYLLRDFKNITYLDQGTINDLSKLDLVIDDLFASFIKKIKKIKKNNQKKLTFSYYQKLKNSKFLDVFAYEKKAIINFEPKYQEIYRAQKQLYNLKVKRKNIKLAISDNNRKRKNFRENNNYWLKNSHLILRNNKKLWKEVLKTASVVNKENFTGEIMKMNNKFNLINFEQTNFNDQIKKIISNDIKNLKIIFLITFFLTRYLNDKNNITKNLNDLCKSISNNKQKIIRSKIHQERVFLNKQNIRLNYELIIEKKRLKSRIEQNDLFLVNKEKFSKNIHELIKFINKSFKMWEKKDRKIIKKRYDVEIKFLRQFTLIKNLSYQNNLIDVNNEIRKVKKLLSGKASEIAALERKMFSLIKQTQQTLRQKNIKSSYFDQFLFSSMTKQKQKILLIAHIINYWKKFEVNQSKLLNYLLEYLDLKFVNKDVVDNELTKKMKIIILLSIINKKSLFVINFKNLKIKNEDLTVLNFFINQVLNHTQFTFLTLNFNLEQILKIKFSEHLVIDKGLITFREQNCTELKLEKIPETINFVTYFKNNYKSIFHKKIANSQKTVITY